MPEVLHGGYAVETGRGGCGNVVQAGAGAVEDALAVEVVAGQAGQALKDGLPFCRVARIEDRLGLKSLERGGFSSRVRVSVIGASRQGQPDCQGKSEEGQEKGKF